MSTIEANITIDLPEDSDPDQVAKIMRRAISKLNGLKTYVNVIEVDHPHLMSPIHLSKKNKA